VVRRGVGRVRTRTRRLEDREGGLLLGVRTAVRQMCCAPVEVLLGQSARGRDSDECSQSLGACVGVKGQNQLCFLRDFQFCNPTYFNLKQR
jgi:hypothetical protein